jgi:hypothetical protein
MASVALSICQHVQISWESVNEDHLVILGDLTLGFLASNAPKLPSVLHTRASLDQILVFLECSTLLHIFYIPLIGLQLHRLIMAKRQSKLVKNMADKLQAHKVYAVLCSKTSSFSIP